MTVPANLIAGLLGSSSAGHVSVSIVTPLSGSNIGNNTTPESITGVASSTAGNIVTLEYQIDGGSWNNFTFTPATSVNYSGGNAGELGAGTHTVAVKAIDSASNTTTTTSTYSITGAPPVTSYSWTPEFVYEGQNTYLTVSNAAPFATVAYTQTEYDAHGNIIGTGGMTTLGTTNGAGNFSYTATTSWSSGGWQDTSILYVGGVEVGTFSFANFGGGGSVSYLPSVAPNGTTITLDITNSWGSSTVTQTTVYSPSGTVQGPTTLGATSTSGNFSSSGTAGWGTDTSCETTVYLDGVSIGSFGFTK